MLGLKRSRVHYSGGRLGAAAFEADSRKRKNTDTESSDTTRTERTSVRAATEAASSCTLSEMTIRCRSDQMAPRNSRSAKTLASGLRGHHHQPFSLNSLPIFANEAGTEASTSPTAINKAIVSSSDRPEAEAAAISSRATTNETVKERSCPNEPIAAPASAIASLSSLRCDSRHDLTALTTDAIRIPSEGEGCVDKRAVCKSRSGGERATLRRQDIRINRCSKTLLSITAKRASNRAVVVVGVVVGVDLRDLLKHLKLSRCGASHVLPTVRRVCGWVRRRLETPTASLAVGSRYTSGCDAPLLCKGVMLHAGADGRRCRIGACAALLVSFEWMAFARPHVQLGSEMVRAARELAALFLGADWQMLELSELDSEARALLRGAAAVEAAVSLQTTLPTAAGDGGLLALQLCWFRHAAFPRCRLSIDLHEKIVSALLAQRFDQIPYIGALEPLLAGAVANIGVTPPSPGLTSSDYELLVSGGSGDDAAAFDAGDADAASTMLPICCAELRAEVATPSVCGQSILSDCCTELAR